MGSNVNRYPLETCFADMISKRQKDLWSPQVCNIHGPKECEHELLTRTDDLFRWMCCPKWQRKLSNKLNAKEFASKCGVRTAELYWFGDSPQKIPFAHLPDSFTVKLSNGSGSKQVIPVSRGRDLIRGCPISKMEIRSLLTQMLKDIDDDLNLILVEELLEERAGKLPHDYKFFCFYGKVQVLYEYDRTVNTHSWYDKYWGPIANPMHIARPRGQILPKPPNLQSLIEAAESLARAYSFPFVRIDLYNIRGVPFFGEFTHTPFGNELEDFTPFANLILGLLWQNRSFDFLEICHNLTESSL